MKYFHIKCQKKFPFADGYFFSISNFAIIEKMGSGKVLIQDGKEISLLKSGAVKKKKKKTVKGSRHTRQFFSSVRVIFLFGHFALCSVQVNSALHTGQ